MNGKELRYYIGGK